MTVILAANAFTVAKKVFLAISPKSLHIYKYTVY